jgi:hypothetical protein
LEEITKDWSMELLIPTNPMEISDFDSLETTGRIHPDLAGQRKLKRFRI